MALSFEESKKKFMAQTAVQSAEPMIMSIIYIKDDKTQQALRPRMLLFNSPGEAITALNKNSDTYAGQFVMIRDENGKYQPYIVQASGDSSFVVEPTVTANAGFVWQEF